MSSPVTVGVVCTRWINLSGNQLTGSLPSEISNMRALTYARGWSERWARDLAVQVVCTCAAVWLFGYLAVFVRVPVCVRVRARVRVIVHVCVCRVRVRMRVRVCERGRGCMRLQTCQLCDCDCVRRPGILRWATCP